MGWFGGFIVIAIIFAFGFDEIKGKPNNGCFGYLLWLLIGILGIAVLFYVILFLIFLMAVLS